MKRTPAETVIYKFGGVVKASRALGVGHSVVSMWKQKGLIPAKHQDRVKQALGSKITYKEIVVGTT